MLPSVLLCLSGRFPFRLFALELRPVCLIMWLITIFRHRTLLISLHVVVSIFIYLFYWFYFFFTALRWLGLGWRFSCWINLLSWLNLISYGIRNELAIFASDFILFISFGFEIILLILLQFGCWNVQSCSISGENGMVISTPSVGGSGNYLVGSSGKFELTRLSFLSRVVSRLTHLQNDSAVNTRALPPLPASFPPLPPPTERNLAKFTTVYHAMQGIVFKPRYLVELELWGSPDAYDTENS